MFPSVVKNFLYENNEKKGCYCLAINEYKNIVQAFGDEKLLGINTPQFNMRVVDYLPGVLTETFEDNFKIPFYNISSNCVCNIYFLKFPSISYIILIDKSEIFNVTQKYQQFAHDDNISKNKFKRLAKKLKKSQKKLVKSNKEKATLIAMLSHELGTPLTSIIGFSELLLNNNEKCKKSAEIINRNANYLKHMIENTLMFGHTEANEMQTKVETIVVSDLFESLYNNVLSAADHKHLELDIKHGTINSINIDITKTKQILINLLNNAVKYTDVGSVKLDFLNYNKNYIFTVTDTGLGVPKNMQKDIFNPWKRVNASNEKGTGIGLFISQKLAQSLGGEIKLISSSETNGSVFQFCVPEKQLTLKKKDYIIDTKPCVGKSILIIDDDDDILMLIEALLEPSNLKIYSANNLPQARSLLLIESIDIILTDLNLGPVKAYSFINEIKEINQAIPILLMTAMPSEKKIKSYKAHGFEDVISKPLNSNKLITTIIENI